MPRTIPIPRLGLRLFSSCLLPGCLLIWAWVLCSDHVLAQQGTWQTPSDNTVFTDPVETGRDALDSHWSYPWYDKAKDDTRGIVLPAKKTPPAPPPPPTAGPTTPGDFQWLAWFLLVVIAVILIWIMLRVFLQQDEAATVTNQRKVEYVSNSTRLADLPVEVSPIVKDFYTEALRLAELGQLGLATTYLYSHVLVRLSQANLIQLSKGKTNRQYLHSLVEKPGLWQYFSRLMRMFEDNYFGDHPPTAERFASCAQEWPRWEQELLAMAGFTIQHRGTS